MKNDLKIAAIFFLISGVILTVSAVFVVYQMHKQPCVRVTMHRMRVIETSIYHYYVSQSPKQLPSSLQDLVSPPNGEPPYLFEQQISDGWDQEIDFSISGPKKIVLTSRGPDQVVGSQDDITLEIELRGSP